MLMIHLAPLFKARNIEKPYSFLITNGFTHHTATRLVSKQIKVIRLDYIEKLCLILRCTPQDILKWKPDSRNIMDALHPMHKWNRSPLNISWEKTFTELSIEDLEEIAKLVRKKRHGGS
ncbi:MAG: helix-turn-helix transcriptional regulator [Bacteroidota bacterium]